ncbi:MAG: DUF4911 domain-containing protein [Syntrophomonadaceae bacterium]|nr:DUF4911 domain-containing protein [Syntrophomonadaceae bacterium]
MRIKINPADIDFLTRVFEGYDYLGVVSTIDRQAGEVAIWTTPDTRKEVLEILENFPRLLELREDG